MTAPTIVRTPAGTARPADIDPQPGEHPTDVRCSPVADDAHPAGRSRSGGHLDCTSCPTYAVGDRVRVIADVTWAGRPHAGQVGTVVAIGPYAGGMAYFVHVFDNTTPLPAWHTEIEAAHP